MNVLHVNLAGVDYFQTIGIPLVRGRFFTTDDREGAPRVAIATESLAKQFWPGGDALGERFGYSGPGDRSFEVVGIVGDVRVGTLRGGVRPMMYHPHAQVYDLMGAQMELVTRTVAASQPAMAEVQRRVRAAGAEVPILSARTLTAHLREGVRHERQAAKLLTLFAGVALILASVGLYAVTAQAVAERVPEIGIRLALGSSRWDILKIFLRQGMMLTTVGLGLGLPLALAASRLLSSLLFGVSPADPGTLAATCLLLGVVVVLACYVPARRASRVDPMVALRYE
jgi:putative ABC transport system permease protein